MAMGEDDEDVVVLPSGGPLSSENELNDSGPTGSVSLTRWVLAGNETPPQFNRFHCPSMVKSITQLVAQRRPYCLVEREVFFTHEDALDKIFASHWITPDQLLLGTKNNKLVLLLHPGRADARTTFIPLPASRSKLPVEPSGIHFFQLSPSGRLMATGTTNPNDIGIFLYPEMTPLAVLEGFSDWAFDGVWLDECTLAAAGRDHSLAVWRLPPEGTSDTFPFFRPAVHNLQAHRNKVREIKLDRGASCCALPDLDCCFLCCADDGKFATMGPDRQIKIWDSGTISEVAVWGIPEDRDYTSMAFEDETHRFIIGSHTHLCLVDHRAPMTTIIRSRSFGIRSLLAEGHILSIGGGDGTLSFLDTRTERFLEVTTPTGARGLFTAGRGSLVRDDTWQMYFDPSWQVPNSLYTMAYDPSGRLLFTGGGPYPCGLKGVYAALW
ncbi:putative DDB1- and CUL4-associated factor 12 [Paratrimastix pyriformis]|uniref:DDB1- and CUL4-associated factor 12 n=1 Tax=Paratrimastix pyriformis TaxID=342808 RepID=A0ABQ8ULQ9_9EUKA|nr:putative DDB1- and CUL4-associated factor 12 [Paratrimastix pyriformis]